MHAAQIPSRTLLDVGALPFGDLVRFAAREGRRPRPIYQVHKWFARRLGCTFRALLVGAIEPATADFWKAYYESADLSGVTVLDPFVGGGTSVVEATRLGASTIGVDVDPIACAVTQAELSAASIEDLGPTLRTLQESVGRAIAPLHATRGRNGEDLAVVHHFWVQVVQCPSCGKEGEAHPNFLLAEEAGRSRWAFCKKCHAVHELDEGQEWFSCTRCRTETIVELGPVTLGSYTCDACWNCVPLIDLARAAAAPPTWLLFAVEASPRISGPTVPMKERTFREATEADRAVFAIARKLLAKEIARDPTFLPNYKIDVQHRTDSRLADYGYTQWSQLFNDRQLLHLGLLARAIRELPEPKRRALGLAFSNHLTTNCMMTAYAAGWRRLTPLFSIRAFRHIPRPIEVNPWSDGTGRGSFPNAVRQVVRASAFAKSPKEPARRGGFRDVPAIAPSAPPRVFSGNARELEGIPAETVDMVLTDPPYFDNVAYSELSDFFQPWLEHLALVPAAAERRALVKRALRARRSSEDSLEEFALHLGEAFSEVRRVLKPHGLLAFTFRHSTADAWFAMGKALALSGLRPAQVLPMPGEAGAGLHMHDGTSLWDAVLVFRKRSAVEPVTALSEEQVTAARANARRWRDRFRQQDRVPFNGSDFVNLYRASLVGASLGLYGGGRRGAKDLRAALETAGEI